MPIVLDAEKIVDTKGFDLHILRDLVGDLNVANIMPAIKFVRRSPKTLVELFITRMNDLPSSYRDDIRLERQYETFDEFCDILNKHKHEIKSLYPLDLKKKKEVTILNDRMSRVPYSRSVSFVELLLEMKPKKGYKREWMVRKADELYCERRGKDKTNIKTSSKYFEFVIPFAVRLGLVVAKNHAYHKTKYYKNFTDEAIYNLWLIKDSEKRTE